MSWEHEKTLLRPGEKIYVHASVYAGVQRQHQGGLATIEFYKHDGGLVMVAVKELPGRLFHYPWLLEHQNDLRREYGFNRARYVDETPAQTTK